MRNFLMFLTLLCFSLGSCRSKIKQQEDSVYSRHLQRHIDLTVITTPMPKDKEKMNLLLFIGPKAMLEQARAKKIIDSLWKNNLLQSLTLVCFSGAEKDYGLEETGTAEADQHQKFNEFVTGELYPFIKKKIVIRKFNSVAVCGFGSSALSAFDIAWNNDEKIQKAGMFFPSFFLHETARSDSSTLQTIRSSRKRPQLNIWLTDDFISPDPAEFKNIMDLKPSVSFTTDTLINETGSLRIGRVTDFAKFLTWAFPK